jgi:serine/threonine-protein kinase
MTAVTEAVPQESRTQVFGAPSTATRAVSPGTSQLPMIPTADDGTRALAAERAWSDEDVDDVEEAQVPPPPAGREPRRSGRSPWTWPLVGLILLVVFAVLGAWLLPTLTSTGGESSAPATPRSTASGSPRGTLTSSTPEETESEQTPEPRQIELVAASYQGRPYDQVKAELKSMGFKVSGNPVQSNAGTGLVLDISPTGKVDEGETIIVTYAQAPATVTVPGGLVGQDEGTVQAALSNAGLQPQRGKPERSQYPEGTVIRVDPAEGSEVEAGSAVTYVVSSGPGQQETTPPEEPTQSAEPTRTEQPTEPPTKTKTPPGKEL